MNVSLNLGFNFGVNFISNSILVLSNYFGVKYDVIKAKIKDYFLSPQCYSDLINTIKQHNVISTDIQGINYGYSNYKRYLISLINGIYYWLSTLIFIIIIYYYDNFISLFPLHLYINSFKVFVIAAVNILFLGSIIKMDFLIEDRSYNLRSLKLFYYLAHNLKSKHKLNDKNYKLLTILTRILHIYWLKYQILMPLLGFISVYVTSRIWMESIRMNAFYFYLVHLSFVNLSLIGSCASVILIMAIYYKLCFGQINKTIKSIANSNVIPSKLLLHLIDEHNLLSIEIGKMNLFVRRTLATSFITSALYQNLIIYLAIESTDKGQKFIWSAGVFVNFFVTFLFYYIVSLITTSAHQSYKMIFTVLNKRKTRIKLKFKVI